MKARATEMHTVHMRKKQLAVISPPRILRNNASQNPFRNQHRPTNNMQPTFLCNARLSGIVPGRLLEVLSVDIGAMTTSSGECERATLPTLFGFAAPACSHSFEGQAPLEADSLLQSPWLIHRVAVMWCFVLFSMITDNNAILSQRFSAKRDLKDLEAYNLQEPKVQRCFHCRTRCLFDEELFVWCGDDEPFCPACLTDWQKDARTTSFFLLLIIWHHYRSRHGQSWWEWEEWTGLWRGMKRG